MVAHTPHTPAQAPVHPSGRCGSSPPAAQRYRGRSEGGGGCGRAAAAPPLTGEVGGAPSTAERSSLSPPYGGNAPVSLAFALCCPHGSRS
jgi:hypothetical protein